jgi:hypothetical protein
MITRVSTRSGGPLLHRVRATDHDTVAVEETVIPVSGTSKTDDWEAAA